MNPGMYTAEKFLKNLRIGFPVNQIVMAKSDIKAPAWYREMLKK